MVRPLSMKERNEIIGLALDIDTDKYNNLLVADGWFEGSNKSKRIAAAVAVIYEGVEHDLRKETNSTFLSIWGRVIMFTTKAGNQSIIKTFPSRKKAQNELNSFELIN